MSSFTITVDIPALDRLVDVLAALPSAQAAAPKPAADKVTKTPAKEKPADKPAAEEPEVEQVDEDEAAKRKAATTAAMKFQTANGRPAVVELLKEFGASNISGIPAAKLDAFIEKASA